MQMQIPLPDLWDPASENSICLFLKDENMASATNDKIKEATAVDPVLSKSCSFQ